MEETGTKSASGEPMKRRRYNRKRIPVVDPDENFYFYWLIVLTFCNLYNLWTLIARQSFSELRAQIPNFWLFCDGVTDIIFILDIVVQLRTGYLEQGLMVYDDKKLALHYMRSREFLFDLAALLPFDLLQIKFGTQPLLRFPRFLKIYRSVKFYYTVKTRTAWPILWHVINYIHFLLISTHWFGCLYILLSEAEGIQGGLEYPHHPGENVTATTKYFQGLAWSASSQPIFGDIFRSETIEQYVLAIITNLIRVFILATICVQVAICNSSRLQYERLLDGIKTYMRNNKVAGGLRRRILWLYYDSWSRGGLQGVVDINTALGLLPHQIKTELVTHVKLIVLTKIPIFKECQQEFLHDLALKMKAHLFTPGASICRKGEVAREMFIIDDGILEVLSETGEVMKTMKTGDFFGEIGILNSDDSKKRTADVCSIGYSQLFTLSREDVLAAMKDYPDAQEILQTIDRLRSDATGIKNAARNSSSDQDEELHSDDWEIHMLAAELNRWERKKDEASSETGSESDEHGSLTKSTGTDSEIIDNETDHLSRPKTVSQTSKGVFKAMSFDDDE